MYILCISLKFLFYFCLFFIYNKLFEVFNFIKKIILNRFKNFYFIYHHLFNFLIYKQYLLHKNKFGY